MNLSVAQKLKSLVSLLIFILVVGTVMGYFGVSYTVRNYHGLLASNTAQVEAGMQAQIFYGLTVRAFKNYLVRKEPKYIDEFNKAISDVREQLNRYQALSETPEQREEITKAKATIGPFETAFKEMVEMRSDNNNIPAVDKAFGRPAQPVYEAIMKLDSLASQSLLDKQKIIDSRLGNLKILIVSGSLVGCCIALFFTVVLIRSIIHPIIAVRDAAQKVAVGDLSADIPVLRNDELGEMAVGFNKMMESLRHVIGKINDTTNSTASSSEQLSATVQQMAKRSEEQALKTNQVATASTEMAQTVIDVAKNTSNIASSATATLDTAHHGADVVSKTVNEVREIADTVSQLAQGMVSLGERSRQIGDIVGVIKDIADQTNLLALNAAIEAARAGEQGRGFAVVADEVRKLAEKTTNSTSQIGEMILAIQVEMERAVQAMDAGSSKVDTGVQLATQAGEALQDIVHSVNELQAMVQQIASATEEMSTVSEHISSDIEVIAAVSTETSSSTVEISQAASNVARLSGELKEEASRFRLK